MLQWLFAFWLLLGGHIVIPEVDHRSKGRIREAGKSVVEMTGKNLGNDPKLRVTKTGMPIRIPVRKVAKCC